MNGICALIRRNVREMISLSHMRAQEDSHLQTGEQVVITHWTRWPLGLRCPNLQINDCY